MPVYLLEPRPRSTPSPFWGSSFISNLYYTSVSKEVGRKKKKRDDLIACCHIELQLCISALCGLPPLFNYELVITLHTISLYSIDPRAVLDKQFILHVCAHSRLLRLNTKHVPYYYNWLKLPRTIRARVTEAWRCGMVAEVCAHSLEICTTWHPQDDGESSMMLQRLDCKRQSARRCIQRKLGPCHRQRRRRVSGCVVIWQHRSICWRVLRCCTSRITFCRKQQETNVDASSMNRYMAPRKMYVIREVSYRNDTLIQLLVPIQKYTTTLR